MFAPQSMLLIISSCMFDGQYHPAAAATIAAAVCYIQLGHACPAHYNPAEFVADLISIDYSSPEVEQESKARVQVREIVVTLYMPPAGWRATCRLHAAASRTHAK
jgi:hypothetical protein